MEPISAALLLALATGAAGAAGGQSWEALTGLVRRRRGQDSTGTGGTEVVPAELELTALEQQPREEQRAQLLAVALAARAGADAGFAAALDAWHRQARQAVTATAPGNASTQIFGGEQGTVVTTRDVHGGLHIGQPAPPPAQPGTSGS
ncbi:hypothetical protein ACFT0G_31305 [Streptomyces sp. NPDC057020]|uniref:hypothetical protein n=1 Tax=unclassified Streptomyces TaxID=2593676 RepID=UPI0036335DC7